MLQQPQQLKFPEKKTISFVYIIIEGMSLM